MWRYRELMPLFDGEQPITLGEGWTPLIHAQRLGAILGLARLFIKDESLNPTNSFKARGLVRRGDASGAPRRADALGAVRRQRRQRAWRPTRPPPASPRRSSCRGTSRSPFIRECELYGADVTLVDGLITDAGRIAAEKGKPLGWYDVSTLKEPYRIEGKKTMAYELGEQLDWKFPDWIIYPTGGGTGMVGMWKAFEELEAIGWKTSPVRPRMVSVQAEHCAPIVRAFDAGAGTLGDVAERADASPTACACRRPSATSSSCARCARAAAPRSPSPTTTWSRGCASSAAAKASARRLKAARRFRR